MRNNGNGGRKVNLWISIGAIALIILLIVWLTIADLWGDTDVAAWAGGLMFQGR